MAEPALADVVALLKYQADQRFRANPLKASVKLQVRGTPVRPDAEVTLTACEDTRGSVFVDGAGSQVASGLLVVQIAALRRVGGTLRIYYNEEGPQACPIA